MSTILYNQVLCSSDYVVFHTPDTGSTSDPAYYHHEDYNQDAAKQKQFDLSGFKRISPTPKFTLSHLYISPENAEPHFTRSVSKSNNGYDGGYSAFLQNNFDKFDDEVNSKYRQNNYDDDEDEGMNSEYRQKNYDDDEDEEDENSKYRHAPKDVEENEHHYYNAYSGDELDRIQSLSQKEEVEPKQSSKNCKIIVKGKAMCRLCKDPVSGAHSESCSFSSAPPEKKYAYIKKEKYIS